VDKLAALSKIVIVQKRELGETLTGFEGKNRYVVHDPAGNKLYTAVEIGNSWIGRQFLKANRPFTIELPTARTLYCVSSDLSPGTFTRRR